MDEEFKGMKLEDAKELLRNLMPTHCRFVSEEGKTLWPDEHPMSRRYGKGGWFIRDSISFVVLREYLAFEDDCSPRKRVLVAVVKPSKG